MRRPYLVSMEIPCRCFRCMWRCQDVQWVEEQLSLLGTLLPDLVARLPRIKAALCWRL